MEIAKKYENSEFGPVTATPPKKTLTELSVDKKWISLKSRKMENGQIQNDHQRRKEITDSMEIGKRAKIYFIFNKRLAHQSEMKYAI